MKLMTFKSFLADENGAVTVDWVVLTAALVGLGLAVMAVVSGGVEDLSGEISTDLAGINPLSDPFDNANQRTADGVGGGEEAPVEEAPVEDGVE